MCNMAKLKGRIAEKGFNQITLAEQTDMDRSTLNRKLKTGTAFTVEEVTKIAAVLGMSKGDVADIFFAEIVA